jgi:hypothetical protein
MEKNKIKPITIKNDNHATNKTAKKGMNTFIKLNNLFLKII